MMYQGRNKQRCSSTKFLVMLLLWSSPFSTQGTVVDTSADSESSQVTDNREILLKFFEATGGFGWVNMDNWTSNDVCMYKGVTCYDQYEADTRRRGQVQDIQLNSNGLVGTTPSLLWQLPYLQSVRLNDNGQLQVDFTGISEAQFLQRLEIDGTETTNFAGLDKAYLKSLSISHLPIQSSLPSQIYGLSALESLRAQDSQITGTLALPDNVWPALKQLIIRDNRFTGPIPTKIGSLTNLQSLQLANNHWTGTLPSDSIDQLTLLQTLDISRENKGLEGLTGKLPTLSQLRFLTQVDLKYQHLSGTIPTSFLQQVSTVEPVTVDLRGNDLVGTVPLQQLSAKHNIDLLLADNQISAFDVPSLCNSQLSNWLNGDVSGSCNGLLCPAGTFSSTQGRQTGQSSCTTCASANFMGASTCDTTVAGGINQVQILKDFFDATNGPNWKDTQGWYQDSQKGNSNMTDPCTWVGVTCNAGGQITLVLLPNRDLTGFVPSSIFRLPYLKTLDLSLNSVEFRFKGISQAKNLDTLILTQTGLKSWDNVEELQQTSVRILDLASNDLSGSVPDSIYNLTNLQELDLSHNNLTGTIVSSKMSQFGHLERLMLNGNQFSGSLPGSELCGSSVSALAYFQASENKFSGSIPTWDNCKALQQIGLRNNVLTGSLPSWQNMLQLEAVDLSGNKLSGDLPSNFLGAGTSYANRRLALDLGNNQFTGDAVPSSWASRFDNLAVDLTGNKFTSMGVSDCSQGLMKGWMDGLVQLFGCNAIVCGKGTYNEMGRQTGTQQVCRPCSDSSQGSIFGATKCGNQAITTVGKEIKILTDLYAATNGENWKRNDGWTVSQDYCSWYGITCNPSSLTVSVIALASNGLTGTPPTSVFELAALADLDLSDNQIDFVFHGIGKARNLLSLDLSSTQLDKLEGLDEARNLLELRLDDNDLKGNFPSQIMQLSTLRRLSMNYNQLEGYLPANISATFPFLTHLFLINNRFSGRLPADIGKMSRLTILGLSGNNLEGTIPSEFNQMTSIETMSLDRRPEAEGRGLYGPLPAFDGLSSLQQLYLQENSLTGPIPLNFLSGVQDKAAALVVDLTNNYLSGGLPPILARFASMEFYAAGNMLTDPIPSGICRQPGWMKAHVANLGCDAILCSPGTFQEELGNAHGDKKCQPCPTGQISEYYGSYKCMTLEEKHERDERRILTELFESTNGEHWVDNDGWLDPDVSVCNWQGIICNLSNQSSTSVESIQLIRNGLEGTIPNSVFSLEKLIEMDLSWNDISITFDAKSASNAKSLTYMNLEHTGLTSLNGIRNFSSLEVLNVEGNDFGNVFPSEVFGVKTLQVLYMSENNIGATLPDNFPAQIVGFSCSKCNVTGNIPSSLGSAQLKYLDLSDNFLTGSIPPSINNLTKLEFIDLSNQGSADSAGLTGRLSSFANAPNLREVYLEYNDFDNVIPSNFLALVSVSERVKVDLSFNRLNGTVPAALSRFTSADFYVAGNQLTNVSSNLCGLFWNDHPNTGESNCDYIACGQGKYNGLGRATRSKPCETCSSATFVGSTFCFEGEREILSKLYQTLGGKMWKNDDGWNSGADVCTWYGVTCYSDTDTVRAGTVKTLDLSNNNLHGTLPDDVWLLTELMELDLSQNDIVVNSFARLGDASSLGALSLSQSTVKSLAGIGGSSSLEVFSCTNCKIRGLLPTELFKLSALELLFLDYNFISGTLPADIRNLASLQELHMVHNSLNGTIPSDIGTLKSIEIISLGSNNFTGSLPSEIGKLPSLRVLAIDAEKPVNTPDFGVVVSGLIGDLPPFSGNPKLREVYLGYNNLGGTIPADFLNGVDNKSELLVVDLTNNNIHGGVPATLAQFNDLTLYLAGNRINSIAPEVCAKGSWMGGLMASSCDALLCKPGFFNELGRETNTDDCKVCDHKYMATAYGSTICRAVYPEHRTERDMLSEIYQHANGDGWKNKGNWGNADASICSWFGITCVGGVQESVSEISLPSNNLKGELASIVFHFPNLRKIDVSGNQIKVYFRDIKSAGLLEEINVQDTLTMDLEGLNDGTSLKALRMSDNVFTGRQFPSEIYELSKLQVLEISKTGFAGTLSTKLGQLSQLQTLKASGNELEGSIPDIFSNFTSLQILDLSENQFYGTVPSSLLNVSSLQILSLRSHSDTPSGLSGPLPSFANNIYLSNLDLGFNTMTGTIPSDFLANFNNPTATQVTVFLKSNLIHGTLPTSLNRFTQLNIDLTDNQIEAVPTELCGMGQWLKGNVGSYSCDGLLCKIGTYAADGRQTSDSKACNSCPGDVTGFMGRTVCPSYVKAQTKKILEDFYQKTGGSKWKNKDGWLTNPDICNWHGITCKKEIYVESINLGSNNLINTPPKEIFQIAGLKNLWLYSNPINFSFKGIEDATLLTNLQLDSTRTKSLEGVGNAPALTYLDVRFNNMGGSLPTDLENLRNLEVLLISENSFEGPIPQFLANRKLSVLRASANKFTGSLPTFDVHPQIKTVDVANNNLVGLIPDNFMDQTDTSNAILLDFSGNSIAGVIPASLSRFKDMTIYARDNRFVGIDPELCTKVGWNGGGVGIFGCDAILCPPHSFTISGRASVETGDCEPCDGARFFGHSACINSSANGQWSWDHMVWTSALTLVAVWFVLSG